MFQILWRSCLVLLCASVAWAGNAPEFCLKKLDGTQFNSKDVYGKRVVVIDFWATWCGPCTKYLKKLQALHERYPDVTFLAISIDDANSVAKVSQYIQGRQYTFPVLLDPESRLIRQVNPSGSVPFSMVIDKAGNVAWSHSGYVPGDEELLAAKIEAARK